jgi:SAM-dependent methyltransferase
VKDVDSIGRFSVRADDYAKFRPSYPPAAIDAILESPGEASALDIVDIGAGTGISLRLLAERGCRAIGIEPGDEMRGQAEAAGLDVREGTASSTGLPPESFDVVTAFQAFHWFANDEAVAELSRILRPGGRLALVWNHFNRSDPFSEEFSALHARYGEAVLIAALGVDAKKIEGVVREGGFRFGRRLTFPWKLDCTLDELAGRLRSSSSTPREGERYESMLGELGAIHSRFARAGGLVSVAYRTDVYLSEKPA